MDDTIKKIFDIVGKSAPVVASALGSPVAGIALSLLGNAFGGSPQDPNSILEKLTNDPETQIKLAQIEADHSTTLFQAQTARYAISVEDRKDARAREIAIHDHMPAILALGFLIIYAAIQFYCVEYGSPGDDIISARLQDVIIMIFGYYFGSSVSQRQDNKTP